VNKKYIGLNNEQIENNQKLYGKNIIQFENQNKVLKNIILVLKQPIFLLIVISIILYIISKQYIYTLISIISSIILLTIKIYQVLKNNKIKTNIQKLIPDYCSVIRNEKEKSVLIEEVTIDDILLLKEGDKVSADAIILRSYNLYADESCFTNDKIDIKKSNDLMNKNTLLKSNYVYKDTFITKGYGIAKVVNIGNNTEITKKYSTYSKNIIDNSNLQKQTKKQDKLCVIASIIVFILTLIICIISKINIINSIIIGISASLVCLFTKTKFNIEYLINKEKEYMSNRNVIMKDNITIENLNKITYLCIDKENFITENKIVIKKLCPLKKATQLIFDTLLAYQPYDDDNTTYALKEYLQNKNVTINQNEYKLIKNYPYNKKIKMEANIYEYKNENYIYVKGNLESIFDICNLDLDIKYQLHNLEKEYSKLGLEVVAVAAKKIDKIEKNILKYDDIEFSGIIGLYNPPKENIKELINQIQKENIKIIMFSKDNKDISTHIGKTIGINNYKNVLTQNEVDEINSEELTKLISDIGIICETSSQNKIKTLNALNKNNEVVGTISNDCIDNTSDVLITTNHGTDISKNVSNIILLDNDLKTIINLINYSNIITKKIAKFKLYNLIFHILSMVLVVIISILNTKIPIHILIILALEILFNLNYIMILNKKK